MPMMAMQKLATMTMSATTINKTITDTSTTTVTASETASVIFDIAPERRRLKIGLISISDRASAGVYQDQGIPALEDWFSAALTSPWETETRLIADEQKVIEQTLIELIDHQRCDLVLTTGGTGPSRRDVTPEATLAVGTKEMPGFGEQMRQISLQFVPTAILSRQVAVIREIDDHAALILNLPGQPKSIKETLEGLKDANGEQKVSGIFSAIPYCIDLIGGPYIETNAAICKVFRPKSALRPIGA
ncbi:molybdopterin adenylyltransferase [Glaciimonas sp. GNP009]|uniref:molybdopterin adenylyltransferase n=2 Tax=Glaciimonas TaxID=1229970 RepID=UPI002AB4DDC1|nr:MULTISPECIES: molybdopterin adenylyltransferase [unclassified Glaciimonas]MDY7547098.1 molybdopterin adenylyltransferase [Glaciimonas sp. CA11.2]